MEQTEMKKEIAELKLNGCAKISQLKETCKDIPEVPGVYFVLREITDTIPQFLPKGTGGKHKGVDLNYPIDFLKSKWVNDTQIIYIGKTDSSLKKRIYTYMRHGKGIDAPHRGGRSIWQLPDIDDCVMGWRVLTPGTSAREAEAQLLADFKKKHAGKLPFANIAE